MVITWGALGFALTAVLQFCAFAYGYGVLRTRVGTMESEMDRRRLMEDKVLEQLESAVLKLTALSTTLAALTESFNRLDDKVDKIRVAKNGNR